MFDVSGVTRKAGRIEIEIISLVILNNFITVILMYFTVVLDWTVYQIYWFIVLLLHMDDCFMTVIVGDFVYIFVIL